MARWHCAATVVLIAAAGCQKDSAAGKAAMPAPMVGVATPTAETVQKFESFTGQTTPPEKVEIRAQVSGYLVKVFFAPGTLVKKDDPLFEIDPAPFQVELEKAQASRALADARHKQMIAEFNRIDELFKKQGASQSEFDKAKANMQEAAAAIQSADALISAAKLDIGYAKIAAPLTGQIGDKLVSEGNLIAGGQGNTTLLTTIVSVDPLDVAFDVDENTIQKFQEAERQGVIKTIDRGSFAVEIGLSIHGAEYPLKGIINFANNEFDPRTGTIRVKASVANPEPKAGKRLLVPGMFARVRVPFGEPVPSQLVPDAAILSDQDLKYVFVVGADNKAVRMDIAPGVLVGTRRVVESVREPGQSAPRPLKPDERVIVTGVQRVRPGMIVDPKPAPK